MKNKTLGLIGGVALLGGTLLISTISIGKSIDKNNSQVFSEEYQLDPGDKIVDLEMGGYHSGMIVEKENGSQEIWMWGENYHGQLGNGSFKEVKVPVKVDTSDVLNPGDKIVDFKLGTAHSGILVENSDGDQEIWMWGYNGHGELGNGKEINKNKPTLIDTSNMLNEEDDEIIDFELGGYHSGTIVENSDGTQEIWMWGDNSYGQLGDGTNNSSNIPIKIDTSSILDNKNDEVIEFQITRRNSLVLIENANGNHEIWNWGFNGQGQLGNGTFIDKNTPTLVDSTQMLNNKNDEVIEFASSSSNVGALIQDSEGEQQLWMWGDDKALGNNSLENSNVPIMIDISEITNDFSGQIVDLNIGENDVSTLVEFPDGTQEIWMWGANEYGQLGNGNIEDSNVPIMIDTSNMLNETGDTISSFELGNYHSGTLITNENGTQEIWMWGDNDFNQLGNDGINEYNSTPSILLKTTLKNELNWIIEPTYNESIDKLYGQFNLSIDSNNVKVIHSNDTNDQINTITPQFDPSTNIYSFFVSPFTNTGDEYYYSYEHFDVIVDDVNLDHKDALLTNTDVSSIIFDLEEAYLSEDTIVITLSYNEVLLNFIEENGFTITIDTNGNVSELNYNDIRSEDIVLTGLSSKTKYDANIYVNDSHGKQYLNSSISFKTK